MYKKLFLISALCFCSNFVFAQPSIEQKTLLINSQDKSKVHDFQEQVKIKIEKHRTEMRARKEVLEHDKQSLINDVKLAKQQNNGKLTPEQRNEFKNRRDVLENKIIQLKEENQQFMTGIDKEREIFFSSLKNKK